MNTRPWEIYTLSDPRTQFVRYVGVTFRRRQRFNEHLSRAVTGGMTHRDCWIRSLLLLGLRPMYAVIEEGTGEGWQEAEQRWITYYRSLTSLTNLTDGGEGIPGYMPTLELRHKWSKMRAGVPYPPGRIGGMKGKTHTPEARAKIAEAGRHRHLSQSTLLKMSASAKKRGISPEVHKRMLTAAAAAKRTETYRQQALESHAHQSKKVLCIETGEVFPSVNAAARVMNVTKGAITHAVKHHTRCKELHFQFLSPSTTSKP